MSRAGALPFVARTTEKRRQPEGRRGLIALLVLLLASCQPAARKSFDIQAAIDAAKGSGGVVSVPAGVYAVSGLELPPNVSLVGAGRDATTFTATGGTILTVTGTTKGGRTVTEVQTAAPISGIAFEGHGGTGIAYVGVAYFALRDASFTGFDVGVDQRGSLQSEVHDVKFVDNRIGLRYSAQRIDYMGTIIPPNRVLVSWCSFYGNTAHAIDYSGGAQLLVEDSEFGTNGSDATSSAIYFGPDPYNTAPAAGLVMRGGWMEGNRGLAAIVLADQTVPHVHSITDTYFATNDAAHDVSVGSGNTVRR